MKTWACPCNGVQFVLLLGVKGERKKNPLPIWLNKLTRLFLREAKWDETN